MPSEFDNRNRFTLFKNDRKTEAKQSDYNGTFTDENNVEFWVDGWIKEGKKGKFISGRMKRKERQQDHSGAEPAKSGGGWARDLDDTGPF